MAALRLYRVALFILLAGMVSPLAAQTSAPYQVDQHIILKSPKGERRCVIVSVTPKHDGTIEYRMKTIDTGEVMTILDRSGAGIARRAPASDESPKVSVSSDPLLASSLRQLAPRTETPADLPATRSDNLASVPKPVQKRTDPMPVAPIVKQQRPERSVVEPASLVAGRAQVGSDTPVYSDPTPIQQVRHTVSAPTSDPAPIGFAIPPSRFRPVTVAPAITSKPAVRNFDREEQVVDLSEKLKNALQPSVRESAAEKLAVAAGADSSAVRTLLLETAVNDPAATVRATCVRCLVRMGVRDFPFQAMLSAARQDADVRVRLEADLAGDSSR